MELNGFLPLLRETPLYRDHLTALIETPDRAPRAWGVLRAAQPFVLAALAGDWIARIGAPVIYITARIDRAYNVSEQLPVWMGARADLHRFGEPAPFFYERAPWGESAARGRVETLAALIDDDSAHPVVITSARAIMQRTLPADRFRANTLSLKIGDRWAIEKLLDRWIRMGYEPAAMVVEPGMFSRRGGILDIFPASDAEPLRIEFFDDEIDSLRRFDAATQRSTDRLASAAITPAREALPEFTPALANQLAGWFGSLPIAEADAASPHADLQALETGTAFPLLEHYLPYLYPQPVSLLGYAPKNALIVVEDWGELRDTVLGIEARAVEARARQIAAGQIADDHPQPYLSWETLQQAITARRVVSLGGQIEIDARDEDEDDTPNDRGFRQILAPETRFGGQLKTMLSHLRKLRGERDRVVAVTAQFARVNDLWREQESAIIQLAQNVTEPPDRAQITFIDGAMQEGWRLRTADGSETHLFTDAEIFGWSRPEPRRRKAKRKARTPELAYADLREGDHVVHTDYGIGRFAGLRRRTMEGVEREYLMIEYAGTDTLFVPIHQTDRLTRYLGPDDTPPTLSRLGQPEWNRLKSRAKKAVEEEARDLLSLYAERASKRGFSFSPDGSWQLEMEASFPFVETDDQLRATREVKVDMERVIPMDRLICGDVGYGKTEVALRAAFKAVADSKQVAILVPTTILAQQHYETFTRRLAAFPVRVEALSRFRTTEEQRRMLDQLVKGELDIIIGTHRLLQKDVEFKDLGLLIVDEEQRFGVKHKEHLKRMRAQVDVLTLTATPIPRTLYMSLTGVRDISMIQTPPEERLPIVTHVGAFDDRIVRQAVLRELERGGQIFVVHNRIHSIDGIREKMAEIVPEARAVIAHGQMDGHLLENIMTAFANGDYDMLISTSIIENGLDIPNANTLIVDRADLFGLSQLYQLRGRVGRGAQQGYAYFFHPTQSRLNEEARVRLETLAEYTELGSGYQIAMRDLELRGAGDILSMRQTGHVAAIGFHLYTQMLSRAVRDLKISIDGGASPEEAVAQAARANGGSTSTRAPREPQADGAPEALNETSIILDLPLPAYLPNDWLPEIELRLQIYRRIGGLATRAEVNAMRDELRDRFGDLPPAVEGLLYQIEVKLLAQGAGATAILSRRDRLEVRLPYLAESNRDALELLLDKGARDIRVTRTAVELAIRPEADAETWKPRLCEVLDDLVLQQRIMAGV